MRPEAGPGGPWPCGSAEAEGWPMGVPSLTSDLVRPRAQGMVRTCPRSLRPSVADAVPSDRLACETLNAP